MLRLQISLTVEQRRLLDIEAARTGRSISALIRDAISVAYCPKRDVQADIRAINTAFGAWGDRDVDGEEYVERLRSGSRLNHSAAR